MRHHALRTLPLALLVGLAACSDLVTEPQADSATPGDGPPESVAAMASGASPFSGLAGYTVLGLDPALNLPAQAKAGDRIPNRYIVVFRPGRVSSVGEEATRLVGAAGGSLHFIYETALEGFAATLPAGALEGLSRNPNILLIEEDGVVTTVNATTQNNATWGIDRVDQRALPLSGTYTYSLAGSGVRAYIVDTGIRSSHQEFTGRMLSGGTAINDGRGTEDCNGHGTHVAGTTGGTVYGVAKGVGLVPVRVLDCSGSGSWSGVIAGVDWIAGQKGANPTIPMVANMSLGGGRNTSVDTAVNNLAAAGVTVVVAAGNAGRNACDYSPARAAGAVTVGATERNDARASYSNFGSCLDVFAPGSSITAAWHTSNTASNTISGTSMAAPHVAGAVAIYLTAKPGASPDDVRKAIQDSATPRVVSNAGRGSPNLLLYTGEFGVTPEPDDNDGGDGGEDDTGSNPPGDDPDPASVAIRSFEVTNTSNPNFTRASTSWQVAGNNLRSVRIELINSSGSVIDTRTVEVSGTQASGRTDLSARGRTTATVRITVTDATGSISGVKGLDNRWIGEDPTQ